MQNIIRPAKVAPPPPSPHGLRRNGCTNALVAAAVVCTVSRLFPFPPVTRVTLVGFKLQVGRLCAPVGEFTRVQVRFIVPEYVLPAERVAVAVALDPVVTTDGDGTEIAINTGETVTVVVPLAAAYVGSLE